MGPPGPEGICEPCADGLNGANGEPPILRRGPGVPGTIDWKYPSETGWHELVPLDDLKGDDGSKWHHGTEVPSEDVGKTKDYFLHIPEGTIYEKTAPIIWTPVGNIRGTDGKDGSVWHQGPLTPAPLIGKPEDFYLQTTNGNVFEKDAENQWTLVGNIRGPKGEDGGAGEDIIEEPRTIGFFNFDPVQLYYWELEEATIRELGGIAANNRFRSFSRKRMQYVRISCHYEETQPDACLGVEWSYDNGINWSDAYEEGTYLYFSDVITKNPDDVTSGWIVPESGGIDPGDVLWRVVLFSIQDPNSSLTSALLGPIIIEVVPDPTI